MSNEYWKCGAGNYIVAGADCFTSLIGNFIDKHNGDTYFNDESVANFLDNSINKYLYSFGTGLSYKTKKMSPKHSQKIAREIQKISGRPFMKNTDLYIDSGGFQVAMGAVDTKDMPAFIKTYHDFLVKHHEDFSYAFSLDLPPGPTSAMDIFDSYEQIEELNRLSYQASANLPSEVKDKMVYIHHFRTPSLYRTWSKFLWEEGLADGFKNFATGGMVANLSTDSLIPVIIYTIPLSEIVKYAMSKGIKSFNFHVLGGANYIDVFYHKLFSHHIKKTHDVDVKITYDSSAIFKALAIGRFIPVFNDDGNLIKMDLKSDCLHQYIGKQTVNEKVFTLLNEIALHYGFKELDPEVDTIYDHEAFEKKENKKPDDRPTFRRSVHMYLIFYMLRMYRELELISQKVIDDIYPLYEAGKIEEFDGHCYNLARKFNQGKNTRKQKAKISSLYKSLNILTDMDLEYNEHLINKFMSGDDISNMDDGVIKFEE